VPIHFLSEANIPDFLERKGMDEYADNCIYIVENLNFYPEEFSSFVPKTGVADATGEDDPELSKPMSGQLGSRNQSKPVLGSADAGMSEAMDGEEEGVEQVDEPVKPPFDNHSVHQFKQNLGNMGDLYINDAPLASLSTSNTVNEIKCKEKVMGMKMTESLRSIAQFFMKQFPLDIHSIYYKQPDSSKNYFKCKSTAVIGGICKTQQEILDKILLANSFLDTFERIILVGEVGLACLHALEIHPGKVERIDANTDEYETIKEFVTRLFEKSVEKGCELILPLDIITAPRQDIAAIKSASEAKLEEQRKAQEASMSNLEGEELKKDESQKQIELSEIQQEESMKQSQMNSRVAISPDLYPNFKPGHWTDA